MKSLNNPPEQYEDAYDAVKELYDSYTAMVNCATSPSGNLNSYTSTFNDADTAFSNNYEAVKMYIE